MEWSRSGVSALPGTPPQRNEPHGVIERKLLAADGLFFVAVEENRVVAFYESRGYAVDAVISLGKVLGA